MYIYLNMNPEAKETFDCVIRAVSFVLGLDWDTTFLYIAVECLIHHDMPEQNYIWAGLLRKMGFTRHIIPDTCPVCYTVKDFCYDHPIGLYLLCTGDNNGTHILTCLNGDYIDSWDSGNEIPIYYWRKN